MPIARIVLGLALLVACTEAAEAQYFGTRHGWQWQFNLTPGF